LPGRPAPLLRRVGLRGSVIGMAAPKDGTDFPKKYHAAPLHPAPPSSHRKNGKCEPFSRTVNTASEKPPSVTPDGRVSGIHSHPPHLFLKNIPLLHRDFQPPSHTIQKLFLDTLNPTQVPSHTTPDKWL